MKEAFQRFARWFADALGSPWALIAAMVMVVAWGVSGPIFDFSDAWQLVINTITNVVTFIMLFVLQATQNRDTKATQLKLDELLRAIEGARTGLVNLEALSDEELAKLEADFERLRRSHSQDIDGTRLEQSAPSNFSER